MALHLTVLCSLSLVGGAGRAIQLIDLAGALRQASTGSVVADVRHAGVRQQAGFAHPALAPTARELGEPPTIDAARSLQPFVPAPMVTWAESASLYDLSWAGRNRHHLMQRHPLWLHDRRGRLTMLQYTFAPDRSLLADQGHLICAPDVLRSYLSHHAHLTRRLRLSK